MKFSILSAFLDKLVALTKKISLSALMLLGTAAVVAAVAFGLYTPTKLLAVIVASIGSCIGTGIISLTLPKLAGLRLEEERGKIAEEEQKRAVLTQQIVRLKELEAEREQLQAEIERQKRMRVDVNMYRPVLKLGISELDIDTYDFKEILITKTDRSSKWDPRRSKQKEYIGVIRHKFKALFGVDLMKLKFTELESGELEISGLQSEFQGMIPDPVQDPWVLTEIRLHLIKEAGAWKADEYKIISGNKVKGNNEYVEYAQKQSAEFITRFKQGLEFRGLHDHIVKMAKEFLRVIFAPLGKKIVYADSVNERGRGFIEYLEFRNRMVDEQVRQLEDKRRSLALPDISRSREVEADHLSAISAKENRR